MHIKLKRLLQNTLFRLLPVLLPGAAMAAGRQPAADRQTGFQPISEDQLNGFRQSGDFNYFQQINPQQNWIERLWHDFWQKIYSLLNSTSYESFWKYVIYGIVILVLVLVVLQLARIDFAGIFTKSKPAARPLAFSDAPENIHEIDFDADIEQAVAQKQYRLAVRLYYLKSLKSLSDRDLIKWESDKTNRSYLKELRPGPLRQQFDQLTLFFELAWYGEVPVDEAYFSRIREKFTLFGTVLQQAA